MRSSAALRVAATALGGLGAAPLRVRTGSNLPLPLALVHGGAGAVSLVLAVVGVADGFGGLLTAGPVLLVAAAPGGCRLIGPHVRDRLISVPVVAVHAVAAAGYVDLLTEVLG